MADDDRLRMDLYQLLHERAERERRWQLWRLATGHAVVGIVLAYAMIFEQYRFIALTPILYAVVVMDGLKSSVRMLYLQRQLVEVEAKLAEREPLFEWVTNHGIFGQRQQIEFGGVDMDTIPQTAQYTLILTIYLGLVGASLLTWSPLDHATGILGVLVTRNGLLLGYGTFTVVFGTIVFVAYLHYERVRQHVEQIASEMGTSMAHG